MIQNPKLLENDPGLKITPFAMNHLQRALEKTPDAVGIRIGIKKAGCSKYEYVVEYAYKDSQREFDLVFTFDALIVLIDKEIYLKFLKGGTVMDYRKENMKEGLVFENPNVGEHCGCGESFTLADESL